MARKTIKLPSLSRVEAGSISTLELPTGPTYLNITFSATGTALAAAHIKRMDVLIDGKVVQTYRELQRLIDINTYYNRDVDTVNEFVLHFFRAEMMDILYRRAPGFGTADVESFHIEMELDAAAPADIKITAHAEIDPTPQPLGVFFKIKEYPFSSSVSGEVEIDKLPKGPFYSAVHLFKADIDKVEVEAGLVKIVDATKSVLARRQKGASPVKRVPLTAKATHLDWMTEGDIAQSIDTAGLSDWRIKMNLVTAGAVDIITETLDTLEGV